MKKILITGTKSYIGTSFKEWLKKWPEEYIVETTSVRDNSWKKDDYSQYDVIFHVAGIAHVSSDPTLETLYYKVNRDLAIEIARKAKADGVKQFIFMSSIIVYGDSSHINQKKVITRKIAPQPTNFYGNSKLQAEEGIKALISDRFKVVVVRPPMIYGKGAKGNYRRLAKAIQKFPMFPDLHNERSMLYIDNLCEFIRLMVKNDECGVFFPQNKEYVKTTDMVKLIAEAHGKRVIFTRLFNPILIIMENFIVCFTKIFGNLVYEKQMSEYKEEYRVRNFRESIMATELELV